MSQTMNDLEERISRLEQNGIPGVRDFFATSALAILAHEGMADPSNTAHYAYLIADAMMEERNNNA